MTCRTNGAAGSAYAQGICLNEFSTALGGAVKPSRNNAVAPAINTTVQNDLALTVQWAAASTLATVTTTNGYVLLAKA